MSTVVHLVRHGEVENPRRLVYGRRPGCSLSARGREQARALAARLAGREVAAVYSSPLERARETAGLIAEGLGLPVTVMDALMESTFAGPWEGRPWEEVRSRARADWETYRRNPLALATEEPLAMLAARMAGALHALAAAHPAAEVVAVSHGDPIKAGVLALTGQDLARLHERDLSTGAMLSLVVDGDGARIVER